MRDVVGGLRLFDAYIGLGPLPRPQSPLLPLGREAVVAELDHHQVEEALVYQHLAREYRAPDGNERLMADLAGQSRLHPQWVLMPHHDGEMPPPRELVDEMLRRGVRAARLYPHLDAHNFSLRPWCSGALLAELQERRVPLFLDDGQVTLDELHELLGLYPRLPVVLTRCGYRVARSLLPLWEQHQNLYLETSGLVVHQALEDVARRCGPERLVFGSGLPELSPGMAILFLVRSEIPDAWKRLIGGETLRRLLGEAA